MTIPRPAGPLSKLLQQLVAVWDYLDSALAGVGGSLEVFDANGNSLGTATGIQVPDIEIVSDVAIFPYAPLFRTEAQLAAMSPPLIGVLYYNTTIPRMQFFDGTQWVILGAGGGVIGIPPAANASWESDINVTGNPVSAWESIDETVILAQASGSSRPSVVSNVFGSTQGLVFDGSNDHLTIATKVITETGAATISIVFKTGVVITGPMVLVSQSDSAVSNEWFEIGIGADSRIYVESNNSGTKHTVHGCTPLLPSTKYNVILCYDGVDYFMLLNGVEENPLTISNSGSFAWFGQVGGTAVFTVGGTLISGGLQRPFNGTLGAVYLWDEDLTV